MGDVSFERTKMLPRQEAARWLQALAEGFARGGETELPVGGGGTVTLRVPEHVLAEFEVEIDGDEVEVELEFTWSLAQAAAADSARDDSDDEPAGAS